MRLDTQTVLLLIIPSILVVLLIWQNRKYRRLLLAHSLVVTRLNEIEEDKARKRALFRAPTQEEIKAARERQPDFRAQQFYDFRNTRNRIKS